MSQATLPPPEMTLPQILWSALLQRAVCVAAKLGLPDLLESRAQSANELALSLGAHSPSLYRLLRTLSGAGIFQEDAGGRFQNTPLSELLRSDVPGSMRDLAIMFAQDWQWENWGQLLHCVMTGEDAQRKLYGMDSFSYFAQDAAVGAVFNRAMTGLSAAVAPAIAEACDLDGVKTVADLAGGHGQLLSAFLKREPALQGILFDLPNVLEGADALLEEAGVRDRVELIPGDFFQSVPEGADLYTLKHIIHDWDDAKSVAILKNVRAAMKPEARVAVIEMVVPEGNEPSPAKILDLQMMVMENGKERTEAEYRALYEAAGLELTRIVPTKSPYSLVEGKIA